MKKMAPRPQGRKIRKRVDEEIWWGLGSDNLGPLGPSWIGHISAADSLAIIPSWPVRFRTRAAARKAARALTQKFFPTQRWRFSVARISVTLKSAW